MNLGGKLKSLRLSKGLTLEQVGEACGVGKSTVRKWETGDIENMRRDKILRLAEVLSVSPLEILDLEESKPTFFPPSGEASNYYVYFSRDQIEQLKSLLSFGLISKHVSESFALAQAKCKTFKFNSLTMTNDEDGKHLPFFDLLSITQYLDIYREFFNIVFPHNSDPAFDTNELSSGEKQLLTLYDALNDAGQRELCRYGRYLTTNEEYRAEEAQPQMAYIRHYLVPAAAGYASPIEGSDYEEIPLPDGAPTEADFCITIRGDSMEPYIRDGELVYVKQGAPLKEFEPGVFFVDGDVFCKQWAPGIAGENYLLSANPVRQDANIIIERDSGRNCVYFGKVLTRKRLPKPSYLY